MQNHKGSMDTSSAAMEEGITVSAVVIIPYVKAKGRSPAAKACFHPDSVVLYPVCTILIVSKSAPADKNLMPPERMGGIVSIENLMARYVDPHTR